MINNTIYNLFPVSVFLPLSQYGLIFYSSYNLMTQTIVMNLKMNYAQILLIQRIISYLSPSRHVFSRQVIT